jgi:L-2-amino-thiazoline-4-carboxylic acid hydrolase
MSTLTHVRADVGARRKVRSFERFLNRHTDSLTRRFGPSEAAIMRREMLEEYRALIPQVPYIGGRRNPWNANLAGAPMALAGYRVVLRHGGSAQDAGEMVRTYAQRMVERIPRRLRPVLLRPRASRAQKVARWTQERRYPDDWVAEFVDGTGQPFDFGMNVTECAIVKFMHAQGADEFTPWLCHLDYVMAEAAGYGLTRTRTLAWGCDRCDFRMTANGTTTTTWPPDFPERTCGQSGTARSTGSTS